MVRMRRSGGFSLLEGTIALAVVFVVAGVFLTNGPQQLRATGTSFRTTSALRLAEGVLEEARGVALRPGDVEVELPGGHAPAGARATRSVREIDAGLWEVTAVVAWTEPGERDAREARLVTLVTERRAP